jgi:retinol-binding protein 3
MMFVVRVCEREAGELQQRPMKPFVARESRCECLQQPARHCGRRRIDDTLMKGMVRREQQRRIGRALPGDAAELLVRASEVRCQRATSDRGIRRNASRAGGFEQASGLVDGTRFIDVEGCDGHPWALTPARRDEQPFELQPLHRLPHRRPADPQPRRDEWFRQSGTGGKVAPDEELQEPGIAVAVALNIGGDGGVVARSGHIKVYLISPDVGNLLGSRPARGAVRKPFVAKKVHIKLNPVPDRARRRSQPHWSAIMRAIRRYLAVLLTVGLAPVAAVNAQPQPQTAPPATLSAKSRAAVLDSVRKVLISTYVDADTGRRIAAVLSARQAARAYDSATAVGQFAAAVTADLRSINRDKHLQLMTPRLAMGAAGAGEQGSGPMIVRIPTSGGGAPPTGQPTVIRPGAPTPDSDGAQPGVVILRGPEMQSAARSNFGLRKVEVLDGNIGYLEVTGFDGAPGADAAIGDALRLLERTDAIIIDVRRNGGGSGEMSHMLFSHFLPATPVPTIRVRDRSDGSDTILTSVAAVTGPRRTEVPLYVLTSHFSASAAEEFAFVLKNKGRATLVGERTAGAGHMNQIVDVGYGFRLSVSFTRVSDAVSGAEWEQVGVLPTIATDAASALQVAHQHALKTLGR